MEDLVDAFVELLYETEILVRRSPGKYEGDALSTFLHEFRRKRVNPLHRRMSRLQEPRYVLSMVGLTNVGKSTLAQALLGHSVAPRLNGPATAVPVEYEHAETWQITRLSRKDQRIVTEPFDSPAQVSARLEKLVLGQAKLVETGDKQAESVVVQGPMELLRGGIVLADTPGFGAATEEPAGEAGERKRVVDYLRSRVHEVAFCVSGANAMISHSELQLFREIQESCSTVIVTKWDPDPDEREREIARYRDRFAHLFPYCGFVFVEAKWAIEGKDRQSINELSELIRENATREKREAVIRAQVAAAWGDLQVLGREPLRKTDAQCIPWHAASFASFRSRAQRAAVALAPTP